MKLENNRVVLGNFDLDHVLVEFETCLLDGDGKKGIPYREIFKKALRAELSMCGYEEEETEDIKEVVIKFYPVKEYIDEDGRRHWTEIKKEEG